MNAKPMFSIGCFAVIYDEHKKVLLAHRRDKDLWSLPGGAMEHSESPHDAVIREVREETGLNVVVERFVGLYSKPKESDVVLLFVCRKVDGQLTLNDEADQLEYFVYENIPHNTNPKHIERIHDAQTSKDTVLKSQS